MIEQGCPDGRVYPNLSWICVRAVICSWVIGACFAGVHRANAKESVCGGQLVYLDEDSQSDGCHLSLRPKTENGGDADFVMTARTLISSDSPSNPTAPGQTGKVYINDDGAGVRRLNCSGNGAISGSESDQDEELVFTFDAAIPAATLVLKLRNIHFSSDSPVLFLSSSGAEGFDFTILEAEIKAAFDFTGSQSGEVAFADLASLPDGLLIDAFKVRETTGSIFVSRVRTIAPCDDGNPCTDDHCDDDECVFVNNTSGCSDGDSCTIGDTCSGGHCVAGTALPCDDGNLCTDDKCDDGECVFVNNTSACSDGDPCTPEDTCSGGHCVGGAALPCDDGNDCTNDACVAGACQSLPKPGEPCGDPSDSDCSDPDTCDGDGICRTNDAEDGTPCADGLSCTGNEVCGAGTCGPDACGQFTGGCAGNAWSCSENWPLGGAYPDNNGPTTYSVLLDAGVRVLLDVSVIIDALQILQDAKLFVTQNGSTGDLKIETAGGLQLEGTLLINHGRVIDVSTGLVLIGPGGLYQLLPIEPDQATERQAARDLTQGTLIPGNLTLTAGTTCPPDCPPLPGGTMILSGNMTLDVQGTFALDGSGASPCGADDLRGAIIPPPKFRAQETSLTSIGGDLSVAGSVDFFHSSANNVELGGNFDQQANVPACFDWSLGGLTMNGPAARTLEVAGRDLGSSLSGFYYGLDSNFSLRELEVAAGRSVTLVNNRSNVVGQGACQEALYVHHLILRANSSLTLNNARIYYETLTQESGATLVLQGCGQHAEVPPCPDADACGDGNVCTVDACNAGTCENVPINSLAYGDTLYTGEGSVIDVDDITCVLDAFTGFFGTCPLERADLTPCNITACATNDDCLALGVPCVQGRCHILDVDDIIAVLDAFTGFFACPDPCP